MDDNVQGNGKNVVIGICDDSSNDDGNDEKRLDELTEDEVYQMRFDMHEDGETFYNACAKVNGFSIRNYNMHKDNAGPRGIPFFRSHGKVSSSDKASANIMHKVGIKTSHIMDFAAQHSGGYESVEYTQKDLYNHFTAQRNIEVVDGDAEDYMCFGDVLIFDATYRTNTYQKLLVILVGVNSHFQTAIFGCVLLNVEAYTWVLERFLDSTDYKKPVSLTLRNISMSTEEEFEVAWKNLLDDDSLHLNKWVVDVYKKTLWAEAYLRAFDRALAKLHHNEVKTQVETFDLSHENGAHERNILWFDLTEVDKIGEILPPA
ncbi:protein FAR1-RELATED SEQUENCE 11-like [Rhododendron vialii]|uniref:protein FAR1-RELATED SEQUENCE 11-like n=1 Tax=Rhododendron vialii TaxID=182163 RepID=UPI00265DC15E|nr:protein FAR1-RELATED SEQUENCE 11-like [Rhododendron vialii]